MKCQVLLALFVVAAVCEVCYAGLTPEKLKELKPLIDTCIKQSKAEEETIGKLQNGHEIPSSQTGKCFIACMAEHMKLMKDGKFEPAMTMEFIDKMVQDKDKAAEIKKAVDDCFKSVPDTGDKCEMAAGLATCMKEHHAELAGMN
uniref:Odorant binding protein 5 n=1 Tax=Laodelphax striatellus TaxID=195883 RepID=A0A096W1J2_LAOST|nr:odorant binding protein 5 [Laodelphax striatellus]